MKPTAAPPYFPYEHRTMAASMYMPKASEQRVMKGWWPVNNYVAKVLIPCREYNRQWRLRKAQS